MLELLRKYFLAPLIVGLIVPFIALAGGMLYGFIAGMVAYPFWGAHKFWAWLNATPEKDTFLQALQSGEELKRNVFLDWRVELGVRLVPLGYLALALIIII